MQLGELVSDLVHIFIPILHLTLKMIMSFNFIVTASVKFPNPNSKTLHPPSFPLPVLTQIEIFTKSYLLRVSDPVLCFSDPSPMHLFPGSVAAGWMFLSSFKEEKPWSTPGGYRGTWKETIGQNKEEKGPWNFYLVNFLSYSQFSSCN